ncbi:MAG TPA: gliding motility-associated C-terminal domain-containing protein, partial [Flavobacteriales bacterium]|nr:gliding motility-associated C-terminal domain-containing protein [Flavobacteriales bacterium]
TCNYPVLNYEWLASDALSCTLCPDPVFHSDESSDQVLNVLVQVGDHQCTWSQPVLVEVHSRYYLPTAFSPNGDDNNDRFKLVGSNLSRLEDFEARVFDRYGNKVFSSDDPYFEWDGTMKGEPVPVGVYAWSIFFTSPAEVEPVALRGNIMVVR